jgi:hypothetical protein
VELAGVNLNGVDMEGVKNLKTPSFQSYKEGLAK